MWSFSFLLVLNSCCSSSFLGQIIVSRFTRPGLPARHFVFLFFLRLDAQRRGRVHPSYKCKTKLKKKSELESLQREAKKENSLPVYLPPGPPTGLVTFSHSWRWWVLYHASIVERYELARALWAYASFCHVCSTNTCSLPCVKVFYSGKDTSLPFFLPKTYTRQWTHAGKTIFWADDTPNLFELSKTVHMA